VAFNLIGDIMANQYKNPDRAMAVGAGVKMESACNYSLAVDGYLKTHDPCTAIVNISAADLIVGMTNCDESKQWDTSVFTLPSNTVFPCRSVRTFNLTAQSGTSYSTQTLSLGTTVSGTDYLIRVYCVDTPAADTTLTATTGKGVFVFKDGTTSTAVSITKKGVSTFIFRAAAVNASIVAGDGISASTDATKPVFTVHYITAWTLGQLNLIY